MLDFLRVLTNKAVEANEGKPLPLLQKAVIGLTAGAIGASVGSPADLALIRMQADSTLPAAQRRNYKNAFHALYRIVADEGVLALWKGAGPTVVRAMSLNMGMLASYDQSVELFRDKFGAGELSTMLGKIDITFVLGFHVIFCILIRESKCQDSPFSIACMCRWGAKVRAHELKNLATSTCYFTFIVNRSKYELCFVVSILFWPAGSVDSVQGMPFILDSAV